MLNLSARYIALICLFLFSTAAFANKSWLPAINYYLSSDKATPVLRITGQKNLTFNEEQVFQLTTEHFVISAKDRSNFTLQIAAGNNYQLSADIIQPASNFYGLLTIPVEVSDGENISDVFFAKVQITNVNDAPVANAPYTLNLAQNGSANFSLIGLFSDQDGVDDATPFTLQSNGVACSTSCRTQHGTLSKTANHLWASFKYVPDNNFTGTDYIQYSIKDSDGAESNLSQLNFVISATVPAPVVKQFEWKPAVVNTTEPTYFHWNIENVRQCFTTAVDPENKERAPSGIIGPIALAEPAVYTSKWYCIDLDGNRFPQNPSQFLEATRTVVAKPVETKPVVKQFEWLPAVVATNEPTYFHWNIENVRQCYTTAADPENKERASSGVIGPVVLVEPAVYVSKWYCIDLDGNRFPQDPSQFLEATRSVGINPKPIVKQFEWLPAVVETNKPTYFHWNIENVRQCYTTAVDPENKERASSGVIGPVALVEPAVYTSKWYCIDLDGNRFPQDPSQFLEATRKVVAAQSNPDWALRTESTVTETSIPFSPYQPTASVLPGVIAAEAGVSGGQAGYTIPINIVPGRAGMQPSVALSYSSRSGNGIAGMGWSLQAASAISRCGSSFATDGISRAVTLTNSDKLCYNGSRLMLVSGTYGANGAEYAPEMDNMNRIVQSGGDMANSATSFTVFEASGRVLQFGSSSNSKVIPAGQSVIQQWLLQHVADATGQNTMRYVYQHNAQAEVLLSQILYTGNASSDGKGLVEFAYQARNDKTLSYVAGGKLQQTQRLASITTSYDGSVVRQYRLGYGGVSAGSGRTLLRQITECAYFDGAVESCLAPTVFNWSEQHAGYALQYVPYAGYDTFRTITQALPRGDVNGDGSRDWNGNFVDAENNLQATHNFELAGCYFDTHRQTYICNQADFNLDGRTDGTDETGSTLRLAITSGEGASLTATWVNTTISLSASSTFSLGRDRIEGFADFNGDGWPDLLMYRVNGSAPDYRVYLHSKNSSAPYAGSGIVVHTPALDGSPAERFATTSVQLTGDMNGDGLADLVVMNSKNRFYSYPQSMPAKVLYNSWNGSTLSFSSVNLPFAPTLHQWSYFSYFIDVNSDGLTDWIGWNDVSGLQYSLNTGKAFTPLADVSGDTSWLVSRSYHAINAVNASEEQTIYYPKYSGAFRVMDVNNDGQSELLVPGQRLIESCIMYGDIEGNRTVTKEFCGDAMYGAVRYNSTSYGTSPIPAESNDESIYRYNAVRFTLAENGELSVALVPTDLIGSATQSAAVDAYGNGLDNLMFTYGTRFSAGQRFNGSTSPLGSQYGTWINRNLGDSSSGQTMMDALVSVSDAAGKTARWNYLPLSSGQNTVDELPLYATSHDYVADNQHFHFASSMYVVSHFSQSNGTGGENQQRYAYRGAVYNHAGKGFSGFRSVIQQDMTRGIIEHADYLQKMPFTGRLQGLFKFRSSEYPGGQFNLIQGWSSDINYSNFGQDAFYVSGAEDAFEQTVQRWALNTVHKAQSGSCSVSTDPVTANEQWQCGEGQHRYSVYPVHSTTVKRDLQSKVQLSVQQTEQTAVDVFGNVLTQTQSTEDDYGLYSKTLTQVFDGSTSWPDKLSSRTVTSHAVQQRHANDPYNSSATADADSWVRTTFSNFHSSRQPQQVAVTASDSSRSKTITTSFNAYGLPLTLTETADVMDMAGNWQSSSRTTTLEYGDTVARADGAFVYRTTNPAQHTQVTKTSAATGLVQSSIDANNLQTQFSYDVFGRMTAQQTPGAGEVRVALDSTSYDNNAPQHAVWMQVTQQRGMPEQRVYFDMLGRDIRTAVQGFEGNWINRDKRFDAAGRVEAESQPYMQGSAPAWTEYSGFDELNRPGQKVTHDNRLSISYQYNGLSTDINAGGLQMSRTYNSQNQLMQTVDAENGITRYSYNGLGLPIVLQDANGVALYAGYNALGMKLFVSDPNQGNSQYQYNGFGELELETDASGVNKYHDYDALGRQTGLKAMQGSTVKAQFAYSFDSIKKGLPASESSAGVVRSFGYDAFSRLTSNTVQIDGEQFSQHYQYHSQSGQLLSRSYPNGLKLAYEYNDFGYVEWEKNAASGYVYRQHIAQDAFGNITQANLGNGVTEYRHYDSATGWVQSLEARVGGVAVHELNYTNYDNFGNLRGYSNGATGVNESYIYDNLHRLESQTTSAAGVSAAVSFTYDAVGNLLSKSDYGNNYQYGNRAKNLGGNAGANAVRRVTKTDGSTVNFSYDNEGNLTSGDGLTISYNSFKQPTQISRGSSTFSFTYGANLERLKEVRDGLTTYEIDKAYEQSSDGSWKVYLDEVAIVSHNSEDGHRIAYSHKDRLGSSITFTDHNGQVTGRRHYDAFGKPRAISGALMEPAHRPRQINFTDIAGISNAGITRRGFTDHRHLDEAELIHMNGRAYDYNLGRFLSVDPVIQSPGDSQSINPYSYIMNNPLAGTDPTGYCAAATGTRIKSCGDMKVDVKVTMKDGSSATKSTVVKNVNFKNGADVSSAMNKGAVQAGSQFTASDLGSQNQSAQNSSVQETVTSGGSKQTADNTDSLNGNPKPIENSGWEYTGQTNGVDTYKTTYKPANAGFGIGQVNDNIITPTGIIAGYIQNKTEVTKRRWSDRYRNHGKIWDNARLVGNYAFVAGTVITAGTTVSDIVNMRNSGDSVEDQVLRGVDGVVDIAFGAAAFFGPVGWGAAALYYGADYLSGGNLTGFIYRKIVARRENEQASTQ